MIGYFCKLIYILYTNLDERDRLNKFYIDNRLQNPYTGI